MFAKINGIVVQAFHQRHGKFGQAGFGITHGCGAVSVNIAKVSLPVNQRITNGKVLSQANHCPVNGTVAVRVIFTDDVTDNAGTFLKA